MLVVSIEQRNWIINNIPNGKALIETGELRGLLDEIAFWMAGNAFDSNDEITDEGRRVERLYDSIYCNN